jgi:hypothetical protein
MAKRILILFIVITFSTVYLTSYNPDSVNSNQEAIDRVEFYTSGSAQIFEESITGIVTTTEITLGVAQSFVEAILFIPNTFSNLFDTNISNDIGVVCIDYENLDTPRQIFLTASFTLYRVTLGNPIWNDDPLKTVEEYWKFNQLRDYGLVCV